MEFEQWLTENAEKTIKDGTLSYFYIENYLTGGQMQAIFEITHIETANNNLEK